VSAIAGVEAIERDYDFAEGHPLRCPDPEVAAGMEKVVREASEARDSVGGIVEIVVDNIPPGLGDPVFGKLDARLGLGLLSMGAVKGVEIGAGFRAAMMTGSENNDPITGQGFSSNNAGGVLGGISTGERIFIRFGVKPTPSIGVPQDTIDLQGRGATIEIKGRHDPCICPRIAVVGEAMTALVLADALLLQRSLG
jgi:chorismate synthase